jgi:hypothetical protein
MKTVSMRRGRPWPGSVVFASLLGLALVAAAGISARAAEPVFPPASRIGLVPPEGFVVSKTFKGFEDRDRKAMIVLFELPGAAFGELETSSVDSAKKQGLPIDTREDLSLATGKALLFSGSEDVGGVKARKWLMFASAGDFTAGITVQIPDAAKDIYPESAVRAALTSLAVRSVSNEELLGLLPFRIDDLQNFKIAEVAENRTVVIADNPQDGGDKITAPFMIISVAQAPSIPPDERDNFSRQALSGLTAYKDMRVTFAEPIRLGGQQGFEVRVDAKHAKSDADVTIVQWMRFGTGAVLRMIGIAPKDQWAGAFPRFRAVRDSVSAR